MEKEQLIALGLTSEQADKVLGAHKTYMESFVPKGRFNEELEAKKNLETQLAERDKQLKELEKSAGDNKELKAQIEKLQNDNKTAAEKYAKDLFDLQLNNAVDVAITGAKGKNSKAIKALLDLEKADLKDGKVIGLEEQLSNLKKSDPYLFEIEKQPANPNRFKPGDGNNKTPGGDGPKTYSEMVAMLEANPNLDINNL